MTEVLDRPAEATETTPENESAADKAKRERDFSKFTEKHQALADFVNADEDFVKAGVDKVNANQVKAILALRTDWGNSPEQAEEREARKAQREAEKAQYAGLTDEQIKLAKQAKTAQAQADKLEKRVAEARAKAAQFTAAANGSGEDLAKIVEAQEAETKAKPTKAKPTVRK